LQGPETAESDEAVFALRTIARKDIRLKNTGERPAKGDSVGEERFRRRGTGPVRKKAEGGFSTGAGEAESGGGRKATVCRRGCRF